MAIYCLLDTLNPLDKSLMVLQFLADSNNQLDRGELHLQFQQSDNNIPLNKMDNHFQTVVQMLKS